MKAVSAHVSLQAVSMHSTSKSCKPAATTTQETRQVLPLTEVSTAGQRCATVPAFFSKNEYQQAGTRASIFCVELQYRSQGSSAVSTMTRLTGSISKESPFDS